MDAERIVFEIVPSLLGLSLVLYSIVHIRRMRADFFTVIRGWIFAMFLASVILFWIMEIGKDLMMDWTEQSHVSISNTFVVVTIWLSVCLVALNTRYRRFSTLDHFSEWMKRHPLNLLTTWGVVGLFVIVYSWSRNPSGSELQDEPLLIGLVLAYLSASVVIDFLLPLVQREPEFAPKTRFEIFGGMKWVGLAWIGIPTAEFLLHVILGNLVEFEGPNPYAWVMVALFSAILGSITETRFTALIVDPEVERAKMSGFRAYDIPRGPYVIEDESSESAFKLFSELISLPLRPDVEVPVKEDSASATLEFLIPRGLLISREYPDNIREAYNIQVTPILWLTEMAGERRIAPTSLAVLTDTIIRFMETNPNSIVLLEGIEYLVTFNEFKKVLRHLDSLNETTWITKTRLLIAANPKAFDDKELALMERDRKVIRGSDGIEGLKKSSKM